MTAATLTHDIAHTHIAGRMPAITPAPMTPARNYLEVKDALAELTPFTHSTCAGYVLPHGTRGYFPTGEEYTAREAVDLIMEIREKAKQADVFIFISYNTPVAYITSSGDVAALATKISTTTTRQINMFKAIWGNWN